MKAVRRGPFGTAAADYFEAGWKAPFPLPERKKWPPPFDWTGASKQHSGVDVPRSQLETWVAENGSGNIALRLPRDVLGIDVDMYGEKTGRATLASAEEAWGPLPRTWMSSSRGDGSGIRLFRIPPGLAWPGQLPQGGGIELVRWDHRYCIVSPSFNPDSQAVYKWWRPDGSCATSPDGGEFPAPEELPDLPRAWVEGLTRGKAWVEREELEMDADSVRDWLEERNGPALCAVVARTLKRWSEELRKAGADGGAHDAARDGAWALIGDAAAGHGGVVDALTKLREVFRVAMEERGGARASAWKGEWKRIVFAGVAKVAAEGEPDSDDVCARTATGSAPRLERRGSAAYDYARDETGNAQRFVRRYAHDVRYVEALGGWHRWNGSIWEPDEDGSVMRMAIDTVDAISDEAEFLEDPKEKAALLKFVRTSRSRKSLNAMVDLSATLKGMTVPGGTFDAKPDLLVTRNGTIELGEEGVRFRTSVQEDYNTRRTAVEYNPNAHSALWDKFLTRFQPDEEVRTWLQKLVGYSLLGDNPKRLMIVALGPTSSGKTTFAEALIAALGEYASETTMSIFRDNQDERPRPDIAAALPQRLVFAEEASAQWKLHPDQIKRLTGGAAILARLPYAKRAIRRVPAFTPWLLTNAPPTIENADQALWRRLLVVPFSHTIPQEEEEAGFKRRLVAEGAEAVLAWAVAGYAAYAESPDTLHEVPESIVRANLDFRNELSDFDTALEEMCEFGAEYWEVPSVLFTAYRAWCEDFRIPERDRLSGVAFGRSLSGRGHEKRKKRVGSDKIKWMRFGLRLRPEWAIRGGVVRDP